MSTSNKTSETKRSVSKKTTSSSGSSRTARASKQARLSVEVPDASEMCVEPVSTGSAQALSAPSQSSEAASVEQAEPKKKSKRSKRLVTEETSTAPRVKKSKTPVEEVVTVKTEEVEEVAAEVVETEGSAEETAIAPRSSTGVVAACEMVTEQFDLLYAQLENELALTRENRNRKVGINTWRSMLKNVRKMKTSTLKAMKKAKKRTGSKTGKQTSGFLKPVEIVDELAQFADWDPTELKSRVDVTRYICAYVRKNNLKDLKDGRIIRADEKLAKLLKYDKETEKDLTISYLQNKIQPLFK